MQYPSEIKDSEGGKRLICHKDEPLDVKLTRGQLMGHPLSFPLLCILNLATILTYKQIYEGFDRKRRLPALVNGDDACFRSSKFNMSNYQKVCEEIGFKINESKCYQHPIIGSLNSRRFIIKTNGYTRVIDHVSTSIIHSEDKNTYDLSITENLRSENIKNRVFGQYVFRHQSLKLSIKPWCLPQYLGGLGYTSLVLNLTPFQSSTTKYLIKNNLAVMSDGIKPLNFYKYKKVDELNTYSKQKVFDKSGKVYASVLKEQGHRIRRHGQIASGEIPVILRTNSLMETISLKEKVFLTLF
jgi:hypothetical protein